ncbi:MAG TPA: hypothetical protein VGM04_05120 [Sphingomicrobium sp.]|jgi:hypothetical protein
MSEAETEIRKLIEARSAAIRAKDAKAAVEWLVGSFPFGPELKAAVDLTL